MNLHAVLGASGGLAAISALAQMFKCAEKFPLISCVVHNVPVHTKLDAINFKVQVGHASAAFSPGEILSKRFQQPTEHVSFTSAATAIMTTARDSWMAPADTKRTDGSSAGVGYVHPVYKNDRN
ncbi:hypothetical protein V5799_003221 [Amblyomma americanum]|uniref:Uncharacterized protein n=1 Tax=Amblyomma americanum TaxID=6943 RepID=A0AAQ4D9K2_AMBAM